jgi:eukaryotic-like serine/threonine-protein kinase
LGPYEILSAIGAGGMGEVYRAHDSKLGRDVGLKVPAETFARDAERMARFQREAKVLASLNDPNRGGNNSRFRYEFLGFVGNFAAF